MQTTERVKWSDFGHIPKSTMDTWRSLLQSDPSFLEELTKAFADYLVQCVNKPSGYWDEEKVVLNTLDLESIGFWKKISAETFFQGFGVDVYPEIAEVVKRSAPTRN